MAERKVVDLDSLRNVDLTALDYYSLQSEILDYIKTKYEDAGIQNDFLDSNAAKVHIDIASYVGHLLALRQDTLNRESFLPTAQRRRSILNILAAVGETTHGPTAAEVVTNAIPLLLSPASITIPAAYKIQATDLDGKKTTFELYSEKDDYYSDIIIPAGERSVELLFVHGEKIRRVFKSNGAANQRFALTGPIIDGSVQVSVTTTSDTSITVDELLSTRATQVDNLIETEFGQDSIIYKVEYDENDNVIVETSGANFGKIPPLNSYIYIDYRVGGGDRANISEGAIDVTAQFENAAGQQVNIRFINTKNGVGGAASESIETLKEIGPARVRRANNIVSVEDYYSFLRDVPGVKDVKVVDYATDKATGGINGVAQNSVSIWVLPTNGEELNDDLALLIQSTLSEARLAAIEHYLFSASISSFTVDATVTLSKTAYPDRDSIKQQIVDSLINEYGEAAMAFDKSIIISRIIEIIQSISGVTKVVLNSPSQSNYEIVPQQNQVFKLLNDGIVISFERAK